MAQSFTRRAALVAGAAAPLGAGIGAGIGAGSGLSRAAFAEGHGGAPSPLKARSFAVGDLSVHTLLAGTAERDGMKEIFGGGASESDWLQTAEANFISPDQGRFYFTPTLVESGSETVLFDTGLTPAGITAALADAGKTPEEIDVVVLTHMHPDHIGGLMDENGAATFANARYVTAAQEYDFWSKMEAGNRVGDLVARNVTPLAEKMSFVGDGASVASGITAMAAFGHTPGHMVYGLESAGAQMVLIADLANHYVFSFAHPEWEVRFDMDKAAATTARRAVLGMLAADRLPMTGYHMPFPAAGFVEPRGDGFRFVPVSYQL